MISTIPYKVFDFVGSEVLGNPLCLLMDLMCVCSFPFPLS
jgi:hypothetical protein